MRLLCSRLPPPRPLLWCPAAPSSTCANHLPRTRLPRLTGTVPRTFGTAAALGTLSLGNNSLTAFDPGMPCSFSNFGGLSCGLNSFQGSCVKQCLVGRLGVCGVQACAPPSCGAGGVAGTDNAGDCAALRALFAAWGNAPAAWSRGVSGSLSYCQWDASIVCDDFGRVSQLLLSGYGLQGSVPAALSALTALTVLDLSSNSLNGSIPVGVLGPLTSLQTLTLAANQLSGSIPADVGSLTSLQTLSLSTNAFNGTIPTSLVFAAKLTSVDLSANGLSGTLTPGLQNLKKLQTLTVASNMLSGTLPKELGLINATIDISSNQFTAFHRNTSCQWTPQLTCGNNQFGCIGPSYGNTAWCLLTVLAGCGVGVCAPPCAPPPLRNLSSYKRALLSHETTPTSRRYSRRPSSSPQARPGWRRLLVPRRHGGRQRRRLLRAPRDVPRVQPAAPGSRLPGALPILSARVDSALQTPPHPLLLVVHPLIRFSAPHSPQSWFTGFMTGTPLCSWDPATIVCDLNNRVQKLILNGVLDSGGSFPTAVKGLTALRELTVVNNNITGTLPGLLFTYAPGLYWVMIHDNLGISGAHVLLCL